jgi:integrase
VRRYLEDWLVRKRPSLKPSTHLRYRQLLADVSRVYGDGPLTKLTPARLERLCAELMTPKCEETPQGRGLSSTSVHHLHVALGQPLGDAERLGLVARNAAERRSGAKAPRMRQVEMRTLDLRQARTLLETVRGERQEALITLALTTGMRQGELLALRWGDVGLEVGHLQVRGTLSHLHGAGYQIGQPKTARSRRRLDLDAEAVAALRRHKARQAQEKPATGLGAAWGSLAPAPDLVFTNEVGGALDGRNLRQRAFARLLQRARLPAIRFHDLPHTAATLMLLQGVNVKVVSERLGHSSVAFTMDRYAHVLPSMQREAATALSKALFG